MFVYIQSVTLIHAVLQHERFRILQKYLTKSINHIVPTQPFLNLCTAHEYIQNLYHLESADNKYSQVHLSRVDEMPEFVKGKGSILLPVLVELSMLGSIVTDAA